MIIKLLVEGGEMKPGPAVAQQLGPMGINMGQVISEINKATSEFKGMKVPVELNIDKKTKKFTVKTSSPPTAELIKKELKLEKGTNDHKQVQVGNASIEDVIKIAKIKYSNMLEKNFKNAVKSILGTCASVGIFVENENPNALIKEVEKGKFDKEIENQKTETSPEKRKNLNEFFKRIKDAQEAKLKQEQKAAEEKLEEKKAEETPKTEEKTKEKSKEKPKAKEEKPKEEKKPKK
jgi:large subunit ribosomal protein L11